MNARKRAVFRADVAVRRALVLYRRGESKAGVLRTDSAPLPLSPSQKAKLEKLGRDYLAELRKRGDAGWGDVERDEHGRWTPGAASGTSPAAGRTPRVLKLEQLPFGQGELGKLGGEDPKAYESSIASARTKWEEGVTGHERKAIDDYRGHGYEKTNRSLRQGGEPGYYARLLTESIDKAEPLQRDVVVWRGMEHAELGKDPVAFLAQHGNVLTDKAFVSTSIVPSVAHNFASDGLLKAGPAGVVFRITVPKGTRTPYLGSEDSDEGEHILQRDAGFKVTRIMRTNDGLTVIDAHHLGSRSGKSTHADAADLNLEPSRASRFVWQEADVEWIKEDERSDAAWEDVPRDKGGKWAAGHGLPQGMNAAHKAQHSKLVKSGKHEEAKAYRSKFGGAPASTPAAQPAERFASIVRPYAESAGRGESFVKAAVARKESIRGDFEKLIGGVQGKAFKFAHQDAQRSDWNEEEFLRIPAGQPGAGQFSGGGERHTEQNPPPSLSAGVKAGLTKKENKAAAATAAALTSPEITKWKASLAENHQLAAKATDPEEQKIWHEKVIPNAEKHLALAIAAEKAKQEVQPPSDLQAAPFEPLKPEETGELRQPHQPPQIHLLHEQTSTAQAPSGASKPSLNPETGQPWEVLSATQPPPSPTPSIPEPTAHEPEAQSAPAPEPTSANPSGMKAAHKAQYTKLVKSGQHEKAAAYLTKYGGQQAHTPASEAPKPSGPALQVEHLPVTRADLFTHLGGVDAVVHHEAENAAAVTWRNKLTHVFRVALGLYQGTGYRLWNKALRKKSLTDLDHAEKIRHLQAALDTAPALEKNVTVWRGFEAEGGIAKLATDPAAFLAKMGNVFHDNAFVSTSIHLGKAINFAGQTKSSAVVMRIRVPAGTKTPYLTHSQGGAYEYEHLLQRDSDFKIDRIYKTSDGYTVLDGHYLGSTPAGLSQRGHHKDAKDDPGNLTERDAKYVWQDGDITFRHEE